MNVLTLQKCDHLKLGYIIKMGNRRRSDLIAEVEEINGISKSICSFAAYKQITGFRIEAYPFSEHVIHMLKSKGIGKSEGESYLLM